MAKCSCELKTLIDYCSGDKKDCPLDRPPKRKKGWPTLKDVDLD